MLGLLLAQLLCPLPYFADECVQVCIAGEAASVRNLQGKKVGAVHRALSAAATATATWLLLPHARAHLRQLVHHRD